MSEKKYYTIITKEGCWKEIHDELCRETCGCEHIPDRVVECYDEVDHIEIMGKYLLTDEEAKSLRTHENIDYVVLSKEHYPELYSKPKPRIDALRRSYNATVQGWPKIYSDIEYFVDYNTSSQSSENRRTNWAIKRTEESTNQFFVSSKDSSSPQYDVLYRNSDTLSLRVVATTRLLPTFSSLYAVPANKASSPGLTFRDGSQPPTGNVLSIEPGATSVKRKISNVLRDNSENATAISTFDPSIKKYYRYELNQIVYDKTGVNVDLIILDDGVSQYHPEYLDRTDHYSGSTLFTGRSRVRDIVLDGPYHLDAAYFDSKTNLKTYKFDGRPTCTREGAILWWQSGSNRSSHLSSVGSIPNIRKILDDADYFEEIVLGGPASSGHIKSTPFKIDPTIDFPGVNGSYRHHGDGCAGVACGINYGVSVDSRIWSLMVFGSHALPENICFDLIKIFHLSKKTNTDSVEVYSPGNTIGKLNKSPTIINGSYGPNNNSYNSYLSGMLADLELNTTNQTYQLTQSVPYYAKNSNKSYTVTINYERLSFLYGTPSYYKEKYVDNQVKITNYEPSLFSESSSLGINNNTDISITTPGIANYESEVDISGKAMLNAGVIFVAASGNFGSYQDLPGGVDYNNYVTGLKLNTTTNQIENATNYFWADGTTGIYKEYRNRRVHPGDVGGWDGQYYKVINVGATVSRKIVDSDGSLKDSIAFFTSRGPGIDVYAPGGFDALSASIFSRQILANSNLSSFPPSIADIEKEGIGEFYLRYDSPNGTFNTSRSERPTGKDINGNPLHTWGNLVTSQMQSSNSNIGYTVDQNFSGTSCATPITTGVIALYLEENPSATYKDVQNWLRTTASVSGSIFNPYTNREDPNFFKAPFNPCTQNPRILKNPYVSKRYKVVLSDNNFITKAQAVPTSVYTNAGLNKTTSISLLQSPPDSSSTTYSSFAKSVQTVDSYITSVESQLKTVNIGFAGRNNGGNARFERQTSGSDTYYAVAGGGGAGFHGGGGATRGGGGGGGAGLAREDASVANSKTRQGGNSKDGFVRIWLNEKSDGTRDTWNQNPFTR